MTDAQKELPLEVRVVLASMAVVRAAKAWANNRDVDTLAAAVDALIALENKR